MQRWLSGVLMFVLVTAQLAGGNTLHLCLTDCLAPGESCVASSCCDVPDPARPAPCCCEFGSAEADTGTPCCLDLEFGSLAPADAAQPQPFSPPFPVLLAVLPPLQCPPARTATTRASDPPERPPGPPLRIAHCCFLS